MLLFTKDGKRRKYGQIFDMGAQTTKDLNTAETTVCRTTNNIFFFFFFYLHLEKVTQFYVELISCDHLKGNTVSIMVVTVGKD